MTKQIHLHLTDTLYEKLVNKASKEYRSSQSIVRQLISEMPEENNERTESIIC